MNRGSETLKFIDLYQRMVRASLDGHEKEAGEDILLEGGDRINWTACFIRRLIRRSGA